MELAGRTLLGKYRIEGLLGQGGMGTVWRGSHVVTARKVAIKVLDERFLSNVNVVQRFGREARAASAIQHEGIVEVLDLDQTEEGLPFLVMEFLAGETVAARIRRKGRLPQDEVVRIGIMLLEALEAAHQHGVVHRDLKPDNIFLVPGGRRGEMVKILDFGISHKDDEAQAKLTMTGSVLGTPHYMSPEQAMGETTLDKRVDVYGAGVVLYECLVGDVPFDAPNYNKLLRVILDEEPVPPSQRGAIVDPRVERVILRALEKNRDERWQSARDALDALRAAARRTPASGGDLDEQGRRSASATLARPTPPSAPTPQPGARPRPPASGAFDLQIAGALPPLARDPRHGALDREPPRSGPKDLPPLELDTSPLEAARPATTRPSDEPPAPVIELDETALPLRNHSSSGQHRAVTAGVAAAGTHRAVPGAAVTGAHRAVTGVAVTGAHRAVTGVAVTGAHRAVGSERPISERPPPGPRSSDPPPRPRASSTGTMPRVSAMPRAGAPSGAPATVSDGPPAPKARGLGERWAALPDRTRRMTVIGAIGIVLFVGVVTGLRLLVRPGESDGADTSAAWAGSSSNAPALPEWVLVDVEGVPPGARIWLDGLPGASIPLRVRRGGHHVIEIRADGYEDRRIEFRAEANQRLRADMRPAIGTTQQLP